MKWEGVPKGRYSNARRQMRPNDGRSRLGNRTRTRKGWPQNCDKRVRAGSKNTRASEGNAGKRTTVVLIGSG
jgi:hypothetical protein